MDVNEIEKRVDRAIAAPVPLQQPDGTFGLNPRNWGEAMEAAKLMAVSGPAVPKWLRGAPGSCFAVSMFAYRQGMDPYALASKSYVVNNRGEDRVSYEAQAIHAIIITRAPLKNRLRHEIIGEGDERRCKVWGTFRGEDKPHEYTSETLAKLRDARGTNEEGRVKGSPLWVDVPEVQLAYSTVRQWARLYCPDILLGIYTPDELADDEPVDVTPKVHPLKQRLMDAKAAPNGFNADDVNEQVNSIIEGSANTGTEITEADNEATQRSVGGSGAEGSWRGDVGAGDDQNEAGRASVDQGDTQGGDQSASGDATQAEIFPSDKPKPKPTKGKRR